MIRVRIDSGNAPPNGGIGVYSKNLAWALREYCAGSVAVSLDGGVRHRRLRPFWRLLYMVGVRSQARRGFPGFDIMHFTNTYVPRHAGRARVIATVHDIDVVVVPHLYPPLYRLHGRRSIEAALRHSDAVLTVSEASRRAILEHFAVESGKVFVAANGLSPDLVEMASRTPKPEETPVPIVLYVGHLFKKKNCAWLVRTVSAGVRAGVLPRLKILLVGNPTYGYEEIREEVQRSGHIAEIVTNPNLSELVRLYKSASVVVLPSRSEGFGIPLIEAMFFEKPVVASRIPAHIEVAGGYAEFFDLDEAESLYHALRCALAGANSDGRRRFMQENFSTYLWPNLISTYMAVYRGVLEAE